MKKSNVVEVENNVVDFSDVEPLKVAKDLSKKSPKAISNALTDYFGKNTEFALHVSKDLLDITKDSVKGKSEQQKQFIELCNKVIDNCNRALEKPNLTESEKLELRKSINKVINIANESNQEYQRNTKAIIFKIIKIGAIVVVILLGIIPAIVLLPVIIVGLVVYGVVKVKTS